MKIAHRKNILFRDRQWWDTAVNLFSGCGGYAHSELVFDNGESFTSTTDFDPATLIYPTAIEMRILGRKNGPVIRRINYDPTLWDFTELSVTDSQKLQVHRWCMETIDQSIKDRAGYDWVGVLRFVFKFLSEHPKDWFCSEATVAAVQQIGILTRDPSLKTQDPIKPWTISPNRLRELCRVLEGRRA